MKKLGEYINNINEAISEDKAWNLWDYKENGVHEILIWKNTGVSPDMSDITEIDKDGISLDNTSFEEIIKYCKKHKDDKVDKFHLDFSNANWDKINDIF